MQRRLLLSLALAAAALPARAQDAGPAVRLVVPFATGTTTDNVARIVGTAMAATLRQQVLVDNRPGAGGTTATEQVARATLARRAEGATFASAGNGTSGHLAGELMNELGGRMIHVPYKDGSQALTDLMAGNVDFMFYHPSAVIPHVRSGKLRVLGITSASRSAQAPEVPTLAEQGLPGVDLVAWFMVYAPAGVPAATLERLRSAADAALAQPEVRSRLAAQGVELRPLQGEALARFTGSEITKWAALVKRSGAQVD